MGVDSSKFTLLANLIAILGIAIAIMCFIFSVYVFVWICVFAYRTLTPLVERIVSIKREKKEADDELHRSLLVS